MYYHRISFLPKKKQSHAWEIKIIIYGRVTLFTFNLHTLPASPNIWRPLEYTSVYRYMYWIGWNVFAITHSQTYCCFVYLSIIWLSVLIQLWRCLSYRNLHASLSQIMMRVFIIRTVRTQRLLYTNKYYTWI